MARVRTLNFLPEVFQTPSNAEFLAASLDQIVNPPVTTKIQGYVGSKFGYGINAKDYYVTEPTKTRVDYQLEPGVVFTNPNESVAQDFISYPGMIDALKIAGGTTNNNERLFQSQFYSWDSFTNLDKLVNFNEYYWLPYGPPSVRVSTATVYSSADYIVTQQPTTYSIVDINNSGTNQNPTLTLLRGGTYNFIVDQPSQFWIQTEPGTSGTEANYPNIPTREVFGVENNGANAGVITFQVPLKSAQDEYIFAEDNSVDLISTKSFSQVNGVSLSELGDIDGVTSLDGLKVIFYNDGVPDETGYISTYYSENGWDQNNPIISEFSESIVDLAIESTTHVTIPVDGNTDWVTLASSQTTTDFVVNQTIVFNGNIGGLIPGRVYYITKIINSSDFVVSDQVDGDPITLTTDATPSTAVTGFGLYQQGFFTNVAEHYYRITYVGNPDNPEIRLLPDGIIPIQQNIIPVYGEQWRARPFYRNINGVLNLVPEITAPLDVLYYQDGTNSSMVGTIRLIDNNSSNFIDVEKDILGKKNYTSPMGIVFTNGLKVTFEGNIYPKSYINNEYYVEGVGTAIQLLPVETLVCPEKFTEGAFIPWDVTGFDTANYDVELFVPVLPDYITIARNSISKNAWSRSNRWFHLDVIKASAQYNNNPKILTEYANGDNKAKRPIIEFYPNLRLFNSGTYATLPVDFVDTRETDALSNVAGLRAYYPDVETYTSYSATINDTLSSPINSSLFVPGQTYEITVLGNTDWNKVAGTQDQLYVVGAKVLCVEPDVGTGTGLLIAKTTTVEIAESQVTGIFQIGMYVGDTEALLPPNAYITDITGTGTGTLTLTVVWPNPANITTSTTTGCIVGTDTTTDNYALYPGARVVFGADADPQVANKIYIVDIEETEIGQPPVITLSLAEDGQVLIDQQIAVMRGYNYQGKSFYYTGSVWVEAQQKVNVNQPPLFDVFDENGISFGDSTVYNSTTFTGCKLFAYGVDELTIDDPILSFPVRYSSINNVGDISFDVSLNLDTFNYVSAGNPVTQKVNTGYVYNYTSDSNYVRELGWQTAVAPSTQYQIFNFDFILGATSNYFKCDIPVLPDLAPGEDGWPRIQVYNNNIYLNPSEYTVIKDPTSTAIILNQGPTEDTVIQILLLSDQVSPSAYYSVPINLNNNPLNQDLTTADIGDIRLQYRDIFINAPTTTGQIFGSNNFRDLGNLTKYGTKIIQNSASLALPGAFLRKQDHNLFNALLFNSREYINFKQLLVDTVNTTDYVQRYTPSEILDIALDQISAAKSQGNAFFWSDMLPAKSAYVTNVYTFANDLDTSIYSLSQVYSFTTANYNGVLVYLRRTVNNIVAETQLIFGKDYVISTTAPSLTVTVPLVAGDQIIIKEYNQTYGSYVPNTPTKLGLYPSFEPKVVYDADYYSPTYFILGHDGSYTKLYGEFDEETGLLVDYRDQALLEFERRIYNNLKLDTEVPIKIYEVLPGFFRESDYSWEEWLAMYTPNFLDWVGQNRLDYKTQFFNKSNEFTYNYTNSGNKLDRTPIDQGFWRGVYQYYYDTFTPNTTPWEMLGFSNQPTWWTERYGPAPYTSDNLILWSDLEQGLIWNNGNPVIVSELARPGLSNIIPVNSNGDLLSPWAAIVGNYNPSTFQKDWKIGDVGPVELSYRRSSTWPFDLVKLFALTRPAEFYNLAVDLDNYKYNTEFNQYLVNNRSHLVISDIEVYGSGTAKTSYINWIVDYEKQLGIDATQNITSLLDNIDVRLIYRLAGYSDKTLLQFYVEKGSPNSRNASLLIPDESYQILLYDNQPFDRVMYSSVIVQAVEGGWTVFGNSQTFSYFTIKDPIFNGKWNNLDTVDVKVKVAVDYSDNDTLVPYGTKFYTIQEVCQFLASYAAWTKSKGIINEEIEYGQEINWNLMIQEFMYWTQTGWQEGSVITLNPSATVLKVDRESAIVQPLTIQQQNFILNQNLYPIQMNNICVTRDGTSFRAHTLSQGDAFAYAQFNLSNFEHGIVFDNTTLFNDVIYNLVTGLRQNRINVRGTKTAEWNGTVDASGFVLNQDNVKEWSREIKYTKGSIVKFKNKYWTALKIVEPAATFNEQEWKQIDYQDIQKGLLPNASTRAYESTIYYDSNQANLEKDSDLLSYSLIGYRPRNYLALADLTDTTQVNVYKNLIKDKGTRNAVNAFKGANLPQGGIDYDIFENWAIKSGEYGGTMNENFVEFKLSQPNMTGNPSIVSLTDGIYTPGSNQEVPLNSLFNYGRSPETPYILNTLDSVSPIALYPSAGYVNFNDVKMASYYYAGLPTAINKSGTYVPINQFYVRDYLWLANFKEKWGVYTWKPIAEVTQVRGNINNTATITFNQPHNLKKLDPIAIINFAPNVNGYYIVSDIVDINQVIINLSTLGTNPTVLSGRGLGMKITSQRVDTPADIASLDLLEAEFTKNTVWVDENTDGDWAVYRKSINYLEQDQLSRPATEFETGYGVEFGAAVAYTDQAGQLVGDPGAGKVYRYQYNDLDKTYSLIETLENGNSFGSQIAYGKNIYVISEPTSGTPAVYIYLINDTFVSNAMTRFVPLVGPQPYQVIEAPSGVTNWGSAVAISDDANWIYISDIDNNQVYVYRRQNINWSADNLTTGEMYTITSVGDTDFTDLGAVENKVGITFVKNETPAPIGSTGTAEQVTYTQVNIIDGTEFGLVFGDNFGSSIATNYNGDLVIIGAPNLNYDGTILDWGSAYVFQRLTQNFEAQYTSIPEQPQQLQLAWTPTNLTGIITATGAGPNYAFTCDDTSELVVGQPVLFTGSSFNGSGVATKGTVYYINEIISPTEFNVSISREADVLETSAFTSTPTVATSIVPGRTYQITTVGTTDWTLIGAASNTVGEVFVAYATGTGIGTATPVMIANYQTTPLYVTVNGTSVSDNNYAIVGNELWYVGTLNAGDIVNVSDTGFRYSQTFTSKYSNRTNIQFGYALDTDTQGSKILVGSPYEIDENNVEGAAYSYINGGAKYGVVIGEGECNITTNRTLQLNGYLVSLAAGNATDAAKAINSSNITNIQASATADNKLIIQLVNLNLAIANQKLIVSADADTLAELGITLFTNTEVVKIPHVYGPSQFGKAIKINERGSALISAPVGTRFAGTTFDFIDDENLDNDTVFDNNATRFIDQTPNVGAVYMFDYLGRNNESIISSGRYVFAQSVDYTNVDCGSNPYYGAAIDFNDNIVMVGAPNFFSSPIGGLVTVFNNSVGVNNWVEYRQPSPVVDIEKIQNTQIFSASTNNTLVNLDYMDPLQGKLLGVVRENIDYVSGVDPARYNSDRADQTGYVWGAEQVGQIWFNTNNLRFMNYHQNDVVYNANYWGTLFPGSDVAVYTWVVSNTPPNTYQGPGTPLNVALYCVGSTINASGVVVPAYYFWVRNTNLISEQREKTLSDYAIANYIVNPKSSGVAYMAPLLQNTFALYNCSPYINANDSVFHIGYASGVSSDVAHQEFTLIRENYPNDFLPGLPNSLVKHESETELSGVNKLYGTPYGLYSRLLNSLSGCDDSGEVVPNPWLPKAVQSGVLARPRQSFFYNRYEAIKNYLIYANDVLLQFPIAETRPNATFLFEKGEVNPSTVDNPNWSGGSKLFYDTSDYWEYINWWAEGYDNNTKSSLQVPLYADLVELNVALGTIVTVNQNGDGKFEVYRYDGSGVWTRIGLENGTIQFKFYLWDYDAAKLGYSGDFFDTSPYDIYPSEETRNIVRALNEQIYVDELVEFRNKSLILLFEYIQSETIESQNFLPWLSKTSLIDVSHKVRELIPVEVFQSDNQEFLSGYVNEVKPYHVVIKEFSFNYTGIDTYEGTFTDFDVPPTYNSQFQEYISPQLVYGGSDNKYQYSVDDPIWSNPNYSEWYNNYGVTISDNPNYNITTLGAYLTVGANYIVVDNANGFPTSGVITIGTEQISYAKVDRALNVLSGIVRGVNETEVSNHNPGTPVYIDLPAVVVLDGGRNYSEPPRVTAHIDITKYPAPRVPAQFTPIMSGGSVLSVELVPGTGIGYAVLPEIVIEPSEVINFTSSDINDTLHTIKVPYTALQTGDIVKFRSGLTGAGVGHLLNDQWYYVGILENTPSTIIALYNSYASAVKDHDRIQIVSIGESNDLTLSAGARATAITTSSPVRENNITIRFDRTTYGSQVKDWELGAFYGSFFAGDYNNSQRVASSSLTLRNTNPDISTIKAGAQGAVFEVADVENERVIEWSSFIRQVSSTNAVNNTIRLVPLDGNNDPLNPEVNASGSTVGFYTGMPIKFAGVMIGGLENEKTYYVKDIMGAPYIEFTVSETIDGPTLELASGSIAGELLSCIVGEVTDTAILTINYPGILQVTKATSGTNTLTVPLTLVGTGGTLGFYPNLPIFFTNLSIDSITGPIPVTEFGGIVENNPYYITTVIDDETFTISETKDPLTVSVTETTSITNYVTVSSTEGFSVNDQIIFINLTGTLANEIEQGRTYYVGQIISDTELNISESINGSFVEFGDSVGTGSLVSQVNTVKLTDAIGSMTMNVSLPVSPGQINGQLFTLYDTSKQYPNINDGAIGNTFIRTVNATLGDGTISGVNRIAIPQSQGGTDFFYKNMPVQFESATGNLLASTTYYVVEYSGMPIDENTSVPNIIVTVTNTSSVGNWLTCDDTSSLYVDMPIIFSGISLGGITIGQEYYVDSINPLNTTQFTIKDSLTGSTLPLTVSNGIMQGTGDPYIVVSETFDGAPAVLTNSTSDNTMYQYVTSTPVFDISYVLGGYRAIITNGGTGFAVSNTITISGDQVGGTSPKNDVTLSVNRISDDGTGTIADVICYGNVPGINDKYYFKVISENKVAVYSNPLLTVPVSGITFPYTGFTVSTVVSTSATGNVLSIADTSSYNVNDAVVFTGDTSSTTLVYGQTYYITDIINDTDFTISNEPAGTPVTMVNASVDITMAKAGAIALLPEPFFFNQSVVRFNNRVYVCVISNNDKEFVLGKWQLIDSGDRRLNAMDRTIGYYQPNVNMPGKDLTQLFEGVTYPNSIYYGNRFQPDEQFEVDTILQDQPFYPTAIELSAIVWDGEKYVSPANLPTYTGIAISESGNDWMLGKLTNAGIGATDIIYANGLYVMTSTNSATPILRSQDGISWTTNGYFTPYGTLPYDQNPYDTTSLSVSALALNSVAYYNGIWVAVGDNIITSSDTYIWREVTDFDPVLQRYLNGVAAINTETFTGLVAVGRSNKLIYNPTNYTPSSLLMYSGNGINWTEITPLTDKELYAVASNGSAAIAIGEHGVRLYTDTGSEWFGMNEASVLTINSGNDIIEISPAILQVDQEIKFNNSFSDIVAGTAYYVKQIISPTLITISETQGGSVKTLSADVVPANTLLYSYEVDAPTVRDLMYSNGVWIAVGDEGYIATSTDGFAWTVRNSGTIETLRGITYNNSAVAFVVVGDNNTIIISEDNGVTWSNISLFTVEPTLYDVKGAPFEYGYGPEELVPGNITDNIIMKVSTRAGTNWPVEQYGHTGFGVVSLELQPNSETQTIYSFAGAVSVPAQVYVQVIDAITGLGTTLPKSEYTVDWVNKTIILNTPISYSPLRESLRIDVYEVGNGDQIVKSSTDVSPIRTNSVSGFNEIYVNCYYSQPIFQGSGVIRPGTYSTLVEAIETDALTNRIVCTDVSNMVVNGPISFQGVLFGGVQEEVTYYIKSISTVTNSITISDSYNPLSGQSGPTFQLTTATGSMFINLSIGNASVWSNPIMYRNGAQLVLGSSGTVTKTSSANNSLTTSTTAGLIVNTPIMFCDCVFGDVIQPMTTYYIKSIIDGNEFTISETVGGPTLVLTDETGGSMFVTNDYAFALQPNGTQAKIVFANNSYSNDTDYIVYSLFGETAPEQYDYALLQVQEFVGNGSQASFTLNNNVGGDNPINAIVEIDGLRLTASQYNIDFGTNSILFFSPPASGAIISVATYNDTRRQYLSSQYGVTGNPETALSSYVISKTNHVELLYDELASPTGSLPTVSGDFIVGQTYVIDTIGTTDFTLIGASSNTIGEVFVATGPGTGDGTAFVGYDSSSPVVAMTYDANEIVPGQTYEIATLGTTDWNVVAGTSNQPAGSFIVGYDYEITAIGTTDFTTIGAANNIVGTIFTATGAGTGTGTANYVYSVGDVITAVAVGTGDGTVNNITSAYDAELNWLTLDTGYNTSNINIGDPFVFAAPTFGGIIAGRTYYVVSILSSTDFVLSETIGGSPITLSTATGSMSAAVNGLTVAAIETINNNLEAPTITTATATSGTDDIITVTSTARFTNNATVQFFGTSFGGIDTDGTVYFARGLAASSFAASTEYTISVLGDTDWNAIGFVGTPSVGSAFVATGPGTGTGEAFSNTQFRISDFDGNIIDITTDTGSMDVTIGGVDAVQVSTYPVATGFTTNTLVRIDGVKGSTQLNGNTYYIKVITPFLFELYLTPYVAGSENNQPVTGVSSYVDGGYIWRAGLFYLADAAVTSTTGGPLTNAGSFVPGTPYVIISLGDTDWNDIGFAGTPTVGAEFIATGVGSGTGTARPNYITVDSTEKLVVGTPVYFNKIETVFGTEFDSDLVSGTEYYVKEIFSLTEFSVSAVRNGPAVTLQSSNELLSVSQWSQDNVDRLWVTVNGYRVPSSKLKINPVNEISILTSIKAGDEVTITSMIPSATPNEDIYFNIINQTGEASVYKESVNTTTWLKQPINDLSTEIKVADVSKVTDRITYGSAVPESVDGYYYIGVPGDKNLFVSVTVYNNTTATAIDPQYYSVVAIDLTPTVRIATGPYISEGDNVTITIILGNLIYVDGEFIKFQYVDLETNTLSGLYRGVNGTPMKYYIPVDTTVFGFVSSQMLPNVYYNKTWNSSVYNTEIGDPLQISDTVPADFLKTV